MKRYYRNSKTSRSSSSRKGLRARGGFASSPNITFMRGLKGSVTPANVGSFIKYAAEKSPAAEAFAKRSMKALAGAKIGVEVAGKVIDMVEEGFATETGSATVSETTNTVTGVTNPASTVGRVYRTKFYVGSPPTKTVNREASSNGTTKFTALDTQTIKEGVQRTSLTMKTGFNQKAITMFNSNAAFWTLGDLEALSEAASYQRMLNGNQNAYWLTKWFGVKYNLMNKNRYLKMKVKVHFVRQIKTDYGAQSWFADVFSPTLPDSGTFNVATIPYNLQLTNRTVTSEKTVCGVDPVFGSLTKSKIFNEVFEIQKTLTRTLDPGECWDIDYRHMTGPGLRVNKIVMTEDSTDINNQSAAFYFPIFEIVGSRVECYDSETLDEAFIGTSSGAIQVEMRKHCEIVQAQASQGNLYETLDGYFESKWAYRVYTDSKMGPETSQVTRRFSVDYDDIQNPGASAAAGKYVIPVSTDLNLVRGGKTSVANN